MVTQAKDSLIETRSIDMIPDHERHGKPFNQFTLWFGANMQITSVVDGALAVVFGADALWAFIGLLIGNILGGAVMALHSAQGPRLGLPQMISSRAQFGVLGAILPLILAVVMYLGFASTGTVLSGQAINGILGVQNPAIGIIIFGTLTAILALLGYKYIHALGRVATVTGILGFTYLTIMAFVKFPVASLFGVKPFELTTFLLAVSLSAGWQLTFGPYVADYSRYLPRSTPQSSTFWNTFLGSVIGTQWAMTLGVIISAASAAGFGGSFLKNQVGYLGELGGLGLIAILIYIVIVIGKLTVNTLNAYGSFMSLLTITTALSGKKTASTTLRTLFILGMIAASVCVALFASKDFLNLFKNFILVLLMVFTPWSSVNLIDFYCISKENIDVPGLYDPKGRYGAWNIPALVSYFAGVIAQIPFMAQALYTGPITKMLGGTDISWIVGLVVTAAIYYPWAKSHNVAPDDMIYPEEYLLAAEKEKTNN
ncbi:purine-cytosine permease family protein [Sporomusa acidovorans]|uniref:Allantoin permease n=1 Tax=Sporomusa acidovorans (strain ATCC 49682 / DSM 3132 / Mol) TaxID=1123286 RepID=A0ABZ3JBD3_SPOA4|nr:cytosine permease [Sporomusa acidovorans]OZC13254.1 putative allantoin permease [Sporomusa acidovorans DSM 3132]SDD99401.1 nucleobase:cation symporter-1, NCS1 family [Sporomusa acidovorans]